MCGPVFDLYIISRGAFLLNNGLRHSSISHTNFFCFLANHSFACVLCSFYAYLVQAASLFVPVLSFLLFIHEWMSTHFVYLKQGKNALFFSVFLTQSEER